MTAEASDFLISRATASLSIERPTNHAPSSAGLSPVMPLIQSFKIVGFLAG
jgi:hypothetical protein